MARLIGGKLQIANSINRYFTTTVVQTLVANNSFLSSVNDNNITTPFADQIFTFQPVSERFTYRQLRLIKSNKAPGLDMIPAWLLKDSAAVTARSITHLINLSLSSAHFPSEWKMLRSHQSVSPELRTTLITIVQSRFCPLSQIAERAACRGLQLQSCLHENPAST